MIIMTPLFCLLLCKGTDFERRSRTQEDELKRGLFVSYTARRTLADLIESSVKSSDDA